MTATTFTAPGRTEQSWTANTKRLALIAVAIVVLLIGAFIVGRTTASTTTHVSTVVPSAAGSVSCLVGRPC